MKAIAYEDGVKWRQGVTFYREACCSDVRLGTYRAVAFTVCPMHGVNTLITPDVKATTMPDDK